MDLQQVGNMAPISLWQDGLERIREIWGLSKSRRAGQWLGWDMAQVGSEAPGDWMEVEGEGEGFSSARRGYHLQI